MSSKKTVTMNKSTVYIIGAVVVLAFVGTYIGASYVADKNSDRITLQANGEVDKETQRQYENTSLENKETLSSLINTLPGGKNIDGIEPHTEKKPFGVSGFMAPISLRVKSWSSSQNNCLAL